MARRLRAPRRPAAPARPGLGWDRGSGPGAPRRAGDPAQAAGLLDRRAQQEVESRRLPVHRRSPSRSVHDRVECDLPRLVRGRPSVRPVGQPGLRRSTHRGQGPSGRLLRQQEGRRQDGGHAVGGMGARGHPGRSFAARVGRTLRAGVGAPPQPLRGHAHDSRPHGGLRHPRAHPAHRRRRAPPTRGGAGGGESEADGPRTRRRIDAVPLLSEGCRRLPVRGCGQRARPRRADRRDHGVPALARRGGEAGGAAAPLVDG